MGHPQFLGVFASWCNRPTEYHWPLRFRLNYGEVLSC